LFNKGIELIKETVSMESAVVNDLSEGKGLYEQKLYKEAAAVEISTSNKESKISYLTIST
jgi:hypothetical protein